MQEIKDQFNGMNVPFPDYFVLSVGSGGTAIGIALGIYLLDLPCKVGSKPSNIPTCVSKGRCSRFAILCG